MQNHVGQYRNDRREREGLLIEVIITTRVANPCGFCFGFFWGVYGKGKDF